MKVNCSSLLPLVALVTNLVAQTATLHGQITDESGAMIPGAKIVLTGPAGLSKTATAGANDASYSFPDLPLGLYTVDASAPGAYSNIINAPHE